VTFYLFERNSSSDRHTKLFQPIYFLGLSGLKYRKLTVLPTISTGAIRIVGWRAKMQKTLTIYFTSLLLFSSFLAGCSSTRTTIAGDADPIEQFLRDRGGEPLDEDIEQRLARTARDFLGRRNLTVGEQTYRLDCSGTVCAIFAQADCKLTIDVADNRGATASIYASLKQRDLLLTENPRPGDMVFFDNTYDRNRNGQLDDELSHIGIITEVDDHGNIDFVHYGSGEIKENRLNYRLVHMHKNKAGELRNDFIRAKKSSDPTGTHYLAGQLLRGFGRRPNCR
jgi:NlpC/P60 family